VKRLHPLLRPRSVALLALASAAVLLDARAEGLRAEALSLGGKTTLRMPADGRAGWGIAYARTGVKEPCASFGAGYPLSNPFSLNGAMAWLFETPRRRQISLGAELEF
jgi:hypothetical protein